MAGVLNERRYDVRPLIFAPPATPEEVAVLESAIGVSIPQAFRAVLLEVSSHVQFRWFTDGVKFPAPFDQNFSGDLHWSLDFMAQFDSARKDWCAKVFSDPTSPYDAVWHNKLAFYEVGNGDFLALDLSDAATGQVVYLSHDDGAGHGYVLADDFLDLLARWIPLACTGGEDWQWLPFTSASTSRLEPDEPTAVAWRSVLGVDSVWDT